MSNRGEKVRALFLTFLMVMSVVGMGVAFAGSAAAQTVDVAITTDDTAAEAVEKIETAGSDSVVEIENNVDISISEKIDIDNSSVIIRGEDENLDDGPVIQMDDLSTGDEGFSIRAENVTISDMRIEDDTSSGVAWNIRTTQKGTVVDNVQIERTDPTAGINNPAVNFIDVSNATVTNSKLINGGANIRLLDGGEATISGNDFSMPDSSPLAFFVQGEGFGPLPANADLTIEDNGVVISNKSETGHIRGYTTISGPFESQNILSLRVEQLPSHQAYTTRA